jgi:hypothetical protein
MFANIFEVATAAEMLVWQRIVLDLIQCQRLYPLAGLVGVMEHAL